VEGRLDRTSFITSLATGRTGRGLQSSKAGIGERPEVGQFCHKFHHRVWWEEGRKSDGTVMCARRYCQLSQYGGGMEWNILGIGFVIKHARSGFLVI
jgi:hypothetical protein